MVSSKAVNGQRSLSVTQAAISGISAAMMNTQTASTHPNVRILPSDFFEEKIIKYPNTTKTGAGRKLKNKHIILPSLYVRTSHSNDYKKPCHEGLKTPVTAVQPTP
jgi:hypothetical protein